jgi:hypothetical protein
MAEAKIIFKRKRRRAAIGFLSSERDWLIDYYGPDLPAFGAILDSLLKSDKQTPGHSSSHPAAGSTRI